MTSSPSIYTSLVQETWLDAFGHVNNARFLEIYEQARWQWLEEMDYSLDKIISTGVGMVVLRAEVDYLKELKPRQRFQVETRVADYVRKIMKIEQIMTLVETGEKVSQALFTAGLFDMKERKLLAPTPEWFVRFGVEPPPENK